MAKSTASRRRWQGASGGAELQLRDIPDQYNGATIRISSKHGSCFRASWLCVIEVRSISRHSLLEGRLPSER